MIGKCRTFGSSMFARGLILVAIQIALPSCPAFGFDPLSLNRHVSEWREYGPNSMLELRIPAAELKRARVLVGRRWGYQAIVMHRNRATFDAAIPLDGLALFSYQFQVEDMHGRILQSGFYSARKPADPGQEATIAQLTVLRDQEAARAQQLQRRLGGASVIAVTSAEKERP